MGGQGGSTPILPVEYQQVEYIKSSQTQYINTGILYHTNTVYLDARVLDNGSALGVAKSGDMANKEFTISCSIQSGSNFGVYVSSNNSKKWQSGPSYGHNRFEIVTNDDDGNILFNGTTYTPSGSLDTNQANTIPLWLFARNHGGNINNPSTTEIYRCKFWERTTGELLADFIPCYRKADNEVGMYDLVSETFKTNSGTGVFEKGADV